MSKIVEYWCNIFKCIKKTGIQTHFVLYLNSCKTILLFPYLFITGSTVLP